MSKMCFTCGIEKDESEFHKNKINKDGLCGKCKTCAILLSKIHYEKNKDEKLRKLREVYKENPEKYIEKSKLYYDENKDIIAEKERIKYAENPEKYIEKSKLYTKTNMKKIYRQRRNRELADPVYRLKISIRKSNSSIFSKSPYTKRSKSSEILGCSFEEFKIHIENQFLDGMSWDNRHLWHLDHIFPVSLALDEEHLLQLNHYTNFQPLWAEDNIKKGNKLPEEFTINSNITT